MGRPLGTRQMRLRPLASGAWIDAGQPLVSPAAAAAAERSCPAMTCAPSSAWTVRADSRTATSAACRPGSATDAARRAP